MNFPRVRRVILWDVPRTFLSLVQKIGRCARDFRQLGEAILFLTKAKYNQHCLQYEADGGDDDEEEDGEDGEEDNEERAPRSDLHHINREAAVNDDGDDVDEDAPTGSKQPIQKQGGRGQKRRAKNLIKTRD